MKTLSTHSMSGIRTALFLIPLTFGLSAFAGEFRDDWTWDETPQDRAEHAALEGKPMPGIDVTNWINGQVTAADMKGKVVIVDFYATWCGPCMASIPHNNELLKKYKDQGLVIVGVCTSSSGQEAMPQTVRDRGITYPTAQDWRLKSERAWQVKYYPTYALVDRKGIVRIIGLQPPYVEQVVQKLLAEPAPAK
ncbi:MAG TPA: redoxin domain-containing protein [Candidatus Saccharimonadales bacterium]|nr:redoxin domain-containing protein [Candidatus Saccharimonadales bacterium]